MDDQTTDSPSPQSGDDIGVDLNTLMIYGTRPQVGDKVDLKASGKVTRIENDTAFVQLETVNDAPIQQDNSSDDDQMSALEQQMSGMSLE